MMPGCAIHLGFYYMVFGGRPGIFDVWGLGSPGGQKKKIKRWGASPPTFGRVFGAAGAVQTPKIVDFRPA